MIEKRYTLVETDSLAHWLWGAYETIPIWLFSGNLGSGKTTLIKSLVKQTGYEGEVSSPTFSIVNEYDTPKGMVAHFDLYRIKKSQELLGLGFEEYLTNPYLFIEWFDVALPYLDAPYLILSFQENLSHEERNLKIELIS